jgi:methylthioribulose-1-phosphate dehydratase
MAVARTRSALERQLRDIGRSFHARGWALGTSGNFSAVVSRHPLRLAITASGIAKDRLELDDILECDEEGAVVGRRRGRPSAETLLHVEIARVRDAGAVLHTHSVWSTIASDLPAADGGVAGVAIEGYEMLKGLQGVSSHAHREWIPIIDNDQDMPRLARQVREMLGRFPSAHAFLLRRHGMYTWGATLDEARRHVEILEFLFEAIGRTREVHHGHHQNS